VKDTQQTRTVNRMTIVVVVVFSTTTVTVTVAVAVHVLCCAAAFLTNVLGGHLKFNSSNTHERQSSHVGISVNTVSLSSSSAFYCCQRSVSSCDGKEMTVVVGCYC